ncbi:aminoglycoside 3'-phosphotransferase [Deinococcus maricopensis]|uniref:Kanamycin kinase n=1 Tax=Deinococcus maricopensis (strain DSM 21211 / LMG 22137 / NRRL B-23946 / LB-34) TaxID=709986 RepID=E8U5N2_DEIML|nr:aminoglycoside 3'-phosphotransferase [Deinococcus maricopensis]ADV66371.1 Kanamycin kinase [Deinococcus maricopensis DSM 21211]
MADTPPLTLPEALRRTLPAARWELTHTNDAGTRVYRSQRFLIKVHPRGPSHPLFSEKERLRWLAPRVPVPPLAGYAEDADHAYLALARLPGMPMNHPDARLHARRNADLLARALAELHALPIRDCPFTHTLTERLRDLRTRLTASGEIPTPVAERFNALVRQRPHDEDLVVTHGHATLEHVLVNGEYVEALTGVGRAGLADRHVDLAAAHTSLTQDYDPDAAAHFLDTYGRARIDLHKLDYYARLNALA